VHGRKLLASEEQQAEVAPRAAEIDMTRELECDGQAAFHVARAEPVNFAVGDSTRKIALRRDGVVVRDEHDQRKALPPRRDEEERLVSCEVGHPLRGNELEHVLAYGRLLAALRGDVDELERPRSEAVGERGHRRSVPGHNLAVTARQPDPAPGAEPERGLLLAVFPKGQASRRNRVPVVHEAVALGDAIQLLPAGATRCLLAADAAEPLLGVAARTGDAGLALLIGPEGGLAEGERNFALARGFIACRLGPRIMRTETAGLAALAVLQAAAGDFQ